MKSKIAWVIACLTLVIAGTAWGDENLTSRRSVITPTTPPPIGPEVPVIIGTIVSMDARSITMDTHDGNTVELMVDSRTMMPTDMAPAAPMKVEYKVLDNGAYMAQRFSRVLGEEGRDLTARHEELYSREAYASTDTYSEPTVTYQPATSESEPVAQSTFTDLNNNGIDDALENQEAKPTETTEDERLPETAGTGSWIALLGVVSLAAAGGLSFTRRRRGA
jgi:LPXTG-motif cell wall-anchored protein